MHEERMLRMEDLFLLLVFCILILFCVMIFAAFPRLALVALVRQHPPTYLPTLSSKHIITRPACILPTNDRRDFSRTRSPLLVN